MNLGQLIANFDRKTLSVRDMVALSGNDHLHLYILIKYIFLTDEMKTCLLHNTYTCCHAGAHTIGQARCVTFRARIYANDSNIDPEFASNLRTNCPQTGGDGNLERLDLVTPNTFDVNYFRNLLERRGLLTSDQALFNGDSTDSIVQEYVDNPALFESDFAAAMVRMGDLDPLTGANGEIRTLCTALN